ncbi:MAG: TIGR04540 family protein [Clostridium sp.]
MRAVYRNPKELASKLKDTVDDYLDDLLSYEKLEEKVGAIIKANGERVYKEDGNMPVKLLVVLGDERKEIIDKIAESIK